MQLITIYNTSILHQKKTQIKPESGNIRIFLVSKYH